jgi:1,2-diacylglycerol 3-beta-galactosyltransferase
METSQSPSFATKKFSLNFVISNGGGGHIATYNALQAIIEQQQLPWQLSLTKVEELAARLAKQKKTLDIYRLLGTTSDEVINKAQKNEWKLLQRLTMPFNKLLIKLNYEVGVKMLEEDWREKQPDLVVSLIPLFNKGLWDSLQRAKPGTPVVTIFTDFADCPPAFWIEPETGNYLVCGTEIAVEQARRLGVKEELIVKSSGMVIHPRFYEPIKWNRADERQHLGLDPDCLTGLVLFGGCGSNVMLEIAKRLECFQDKLQLIFICGRNEDLASALITNKGIQKRFVTTFTQEIPYYMHLADFFIGKPGPGSISEALVMKLPVIVESNSSTLPQEQYNADWIRQKEVGLTIRSFRHIHKAVEQFLDPETFARYQSNVATVNNRAVFEIPEILQQILARSSQLTGGQLLEQG